MSPIVWELGLVVGALVVFVVWQKVTLERDMRITREARERRAAEEAAAAREPNAKHIKAQLVPQPRARKTPPTPVPHAPCSRFV